MTLQDDSKWQKTNTFGEAYKLHSVYEYEERVYQSRSTLYTEGNKIAVMNKCCKTDHHSFQLFPCTVNNVSHNYLRTDDRHLQCLTSVLLWWACEPLDRSNLIRLRLTNNCCQNVSASCGRDRSWICHTGIQVKLSSDMASPSTTGLRTFISFMTALCFHRKDWSRFIVSYMADSYDKGKRNLLRYAIYHVTLCFITSDLQSNNPS